MKRNSIIPKSISYLLLVVMLYMHLCSALCASGIGGCCGKEENDNQHAKKSCCSGKKESKEEEDGCQGMHLSFFNTTGQFQYEKNVDAVKTFPILIAVITPLLNQLPVSHSKTAFANNGFHPPPPNADIRILIQSFQI